MRNLMLLVTAITLMQSGCGSPLRELPDGGHDAAGDSPDGSGVRDDASGSDATTGIDLTISARAVGVCGSFVPDHQAGVNHQTPTNLLAGVVSVELMRSHRDPDAQLLVLPETITEIDLSAGEIILSATDAPLPRGEYTHIRVGLAYSVYRVQATAHAGWDVPGQVEIDMALSPHESADGVHRSQGQYTATFTAFGQSQSFAATTPVNCVLSAWGGIADTADSRFAVTVPIPGGPVLVDGSARAVAIDLAFPMRDAFAWRDLDEPGFANGVFDLAMPPAVSEIPDRLLECNLLMADRCQGQSVVPVHPTWPMPDSTVVFFTDGHQIVPDCPAPGEPAHGQDGCYQVNAPGYDLAGGVVHDRVTGLAWQREIPAESFDWWEARGYCSRLELDGSRDWRLPSRVELVSLLDYSRIDPTIDTQAFPGTPPEFFWSSSPVPFSNLAYGVRFELGFIYDHDPYGSGRVRCVRGEYEAPEPRFETAAEVVLDTGTGLAWQRRGFEYPMTWTDALTACEGLELAGQDDWRLPTLKELQTLVDGRRMQPSIDIAAFPGTPPEWTWSSTPIQWPPDQGWATSFTDGYASIHDFDELQRVRCVRTLD